MNIVIRTDASSTIGSGHIMRCLTLANQLRSKGHTIVFICRSFPGNSISYIRNQGFLVKELPDYGAEDHWAWSKENWELDSKETKNVIGKVKTGISLLIVDHYSIDSKWEKRLRKKTKRLMVIDDLADRAHECDLLLDQNYYLNMNDRYDSLLPKTCIKLLGPDYVLLREEFLTIDIEEIQRSGQIKRILIFFGGSDPTGETLKVLKAVSSLKLSGIYLDVVVGNANHQKLEIKNLISQIPNATFHMQVNNMAELMMNADLAIGAGGSATWERCILSLPSLTIIVADNQKELVEAVAMAGATVNLGESINVTHSFLQKSLLRLMSDSCIVDSLSKNCANIIDYSKVYNKAVLKEVQRILI